MLASNTMLLAVMLLPTNNRQKRRELRIDVCYRWKSTDNSKDTAVVNKDIAVSVDAREQQHWLVMFFGIRTDVAGVSRESQRSSRDSSSVVGDVSGSVSIQHTTLVAVMSLLTAMAPLVPAPETRLKLLAAPTALTTIIVLPTPVAFTVTLVPPNPLRRIGPALRVGYVDLPVADVANVACVGVDCSAAYSGPILPAPEESMDNWRCGDRTMSNWLMFPPAVVKATEEEAVDVLRQVLAVAGSEGSMIEPFIKPT